MRVLPYAALLLASATLGASAQDVPKVEVFAGYSYSHLSGGTGLTSANLTGWNGSITANVNSWIGITADFSGHNGSPSRTSVKRHAFLLGPALTHRSSSQFRPFAHALFGGVRAHRGLTSPGPTASPLPQLAPVSETAFGMVLGGGVDYELNPGLAVRLIQADYLLTRFDQPSGIVCITFPCASTVQGTQHNLRLSAGVVWRFGTR